jgi:hypothetical protein
MFGTPTYAECGYVHDCRGLLFKDNGALTWRGELARDCPGNWYPTHSLGPVAQWLGINRGDRMTSLVAGSAASASLRGYVERRFPAGHPARRIQFKGSDSVSVLIKTAKGALIDLRYDTSSPRPAPITTHYSLQGDKGCYVSQTNNIYIEGRSKEREWESAANYAEEFAHPLWTRLQRQAAGSGHGGIDFIVVHEVLNALQQGAASPIDCCDAAAWSAVIPLSVKSLAEGGTPQEIPDFTGGKWETRRS